MPTIPGVLLKKLYQKGSLRNTGEGFEFALKNVLAPGTIVGISQLLVDGRDVEASHVTIHHGGKSVAANDLSPQNPLDFGVNTVVMVRVKGDELAPGSHSIAIAPNTKEVGQLEIEIKDVID